MNKGINIWMLTKWYPNREDPQFGIFIKKHVKAIGQNNRISVLYVHSTKNIKANYEVIINEESGVSEIVVYFKKNVSVFGKIINLFRYLSGIIIGIRLLKKNSPKPDIIHSYILTRTAVLAWFLSRSKKIPFVISEQWSGFLTGRFLTGHSLKKFVTIFLVGRASGISSVSTFLFKRMNECGLKNSNYHVIPNIIESPVKTLPSSKKNYVYILMVADLVDEIKNISGLIRAVNSLNTTIDFQVHIIGRGPDEEHLKRIADSLGLLNRKVFFEGLKTNEEVYQFLCISDFLVMNSRYETFSLICAEAMSCGKPVLATRCGGPNEFVQEKTGILIEPGNEEELKKNLIFMLNNYSKYNSEEIKEYIRSLFSKEKVAISFMNFYESALISGAKK